MSGLRSAIDELLSTEVQSLTDAELTDEAAETALAISRLSHRLAIVTAEVGTRGAYEATGALNVTRWLANLADMDNRIARHHVSMGKILRANPDTERKATSGELSQSRIRYLTRAARKHPDVYPDHEGLLLELAESMKLNEFKAAVDHWIECADSLKSQKDADKARDSSYLHASQTFAGKVKLDGLFDKEMGEAILTALDAAMTGETRAKGSGEELRPASQRRADAMYEICRQFLDHYPGRIGGQRPHMSVIVDLQTLVEGKGKRCELVRTGAITAEAARRIACDAGVSRVIMDGDSVVLDMGREVRTATPQQLRALAIRDGGCTWNGCDMPPEWCDAHHIVAWWDFGATDLDNLRLLCRRHHVLIHRQQRDPPQPR